MGKRVPYFPFYADDFIAGTVGMTAEEVGVYVRLLCYQFNRGSLPVATEAQQRIGGGPITHEVKVKFETYPDGSLRNRRMDEIREKQANYRKNQSEKGKRSAAVRSRLQPQSNNGSTTVDSGLQPDGQPEGNLPEPVPEPVPEPKKSTPLKSPVEDTDKLIQHIARIYAAYPRKVGKPAAIRAIRAAMKEHDPEFILTRTEIYAKAREGQDEKFTPHPATWFNQHRFNDDPNTWATNGANGETEFSDAF